MLVTMQPLDKNCSFSKTVLFWMPLFVFSIALMLIVFPDQALASSTTGLAWESPLQRIKDSISGPVAFAISLLGIVGGGAALIFGGEINDFIRKIIMLVLVISFVVSANSILSTLFQTSGAII